MERLKEAIAHCYEVARDQCGNRCANEHMQLAKWLEDLQDFYTLKEQGMLMILPCQIGNSLWDKIHGRLTVSGFSVGDLYTDLHEYVYGGEGLRVHYSNDSGSITGSIPASNIGKDVFLADQPDR